MGMPPKYIKIKGKSYYRYGIYTDIGRVQAKAKSYRKKYNSKYWIQTYEDGLFFPQKKYALYFNNIGTFVNG